MYVLHFAVFNLPPQKERHRDTKTQRHRNTDTDTDTEGERERKRGKRIVKERDKYGDISPWHKRGYGFMHKKKGKEKKKTFKRR